MFSHVYYSITLTHVGLVTSGLEAKAFYVNKTRKKKSRIETYLGASIQQSGIIASSTTIPASVARVWNPASRPLRKNMQFY
jgi:hypothetical protein